MENSSQKSNPFLKPNPFILPKFYSQPKSIVIETQKHYEEIIRIHPNERKYFLSRSLSKDLRFDKMQAQQNDEMIKLKKRGVKQRENPFFRKNLMQKHNENQPPYDQSYLDLTPSLNMSEAKSKLFSSKLSIHPSQQVINQGIPLQTITPRMSIQSSHKNIQSPVNQQLRMSQLIIKLSSQNQIKLCGEDSKRKSETFRIVESLQNKIQETPHHDSEDPMEIRVKDKVFYLMLIDSKF